LENYIARLEFFSMVTEITNFCEISEILAEIFYPYMVLKGSEKWVTRALCLVVVVVAFD
jgi:hypothetical protein